MSTLRRYVRGDDDVDTASVERRLAAHDGFDDPDDVTLEPLDAGNWLSTPYVVNDEYFVKVVSGRNALTHSVFTGMRNLGARVAGGESFFESYDSPVEMARHEFEVTGRMRDLGVPTPEPLEVIEGEDDALIVYEYLEGYVPLGETDLGDDLLDAVFEHLRTLHDHGVAHGDVSLANVLVVDGVPHFIDATCVRDDGIDEAVAYDLACALGALASKRDPDDVVEAATAWYDADEIRSSLDFLIVARLRPGIERRFSVIELRRAIDAL